MKTMTSREANQDFSRAKREAKSGPVIITERGRPAECLDVLRRIQEVDREAQEPLRPACDAWPGGGRIRAAAASEGGAARESTSRELSARYQCRLCAAGAGIGRKRASSTGSRRAAAAEFFVSVLTMMEIEIGVRNGSSFTDRRQAAVIRAWKEGPLETGFRGRCLERRPRNRRALRRAARSGSEAGNRRLDRGDRDRQAADAGDAQRARLRRDAGGHRQSLVGGAMIAEGGRDGSQNPPLGRRGRLGNQSGRRSLS